MGRKRKRGKWKNRGVGRVDKEVGKRVELKRTDEHVWEFVKMGNTWKREGEELGRKAGNKGERGRKGGNRESKKGMDKGEKGREVKKRGENKKVGTKVKGRGRRDGKSGRKLEKMKTEGNSENMFGRFAHCRTSTTLVMTRNIAPLPCCGYAFVCRCLAMFGMTDACLPLPGSVVATRHGVQHRWCSHCVSRASARACS